MSKSKDIRWRQRFENFEKARESLLQATDALKKEPKNKLYEMALIQAFEFTYELGWKTLKDFLNYEGIEVSLPREVIKQAYNTGQLQEAQVWIDMLDDRNLMAHTYDEENAKKALLNIQNNYLPAINHLHNDFKSK